MYQDSRASSMKRCELGQMAVCQVPDAAVVVAVGNWYLDDEGKLGLRRSGNYGGGARCCDQDSRQTTAQCLVGPVR